MNAWIAAFLETFAPEILAEAVHKMLQICAQEVNADDDKTRDEKGQR
jgi:hypothetical protein